MSVGGNNSHGTNATSTPSRLPRRLSEQELVAREAAAAQAALGTVWRQLLAEIREYPRAAVERHPWAVLLASAGTGAAVGAGLAVCVRDRVENEAENPTSETRRQRKSRQSDDLVCRHDPRVPHHGILGGVVRGASAEAASYLLSGALLQAAPAFVQGFMENGAAQPLGTAEA
jgi:hypothetical protein